MVGEAEFLPGFESSRPEREGSGPPGGTADAYRARGSRPRGTRFTVRGKRWLKRIQELELVNKYRPKKPKFRRSKDVLCFIVI